MGNPVLIVVVLAVLVAIAGGSYLAGGVKGASALSDGTTGSGVMSLAQEYQQDQAFLQRRYLELEEAAMAGIILNS